MIGWHDRLNGHEFEQTPRDGEGQGRLACCSPWGRKESDMTKQLNNTYSLPRELILSWDQGDPSPQNLELGHPKLELEAKTPDVGWEDVTNQICQLMRKQRTLVFRRSSIRQTWGTENYVQYPVINYIRKQYKKNVHMYN